MPEHLITSEDDDIRLDRWFKRHYPALSHAMLEKHLRKGDIRLDGAKAKSSLRIKKGQLLLIKCDITQLIPAKPPKPAAPSILPEDASLIQQTVLYKDANIIVLNKPFGLPVQGGTGIRKSIDDLLPALCFEAKSKPKLVHRLDKDTTGVLVLARHAKAAKELMQAFAGKDVQKTYLALVHNQPLPLRGTIDKPLAKCVVGEGDKELVTVTDAGKRAITDYEVAEMLAGKFSVMKLYPLTGRTHQLRVHMAEIGCPIVGDGKYGGKLLEKALDVQNKLHLHASHIELPPLFGGKAISVSAPLPRHMVRSFASLGIYIK